MNRATKPTQASSESNKQRSLRLLFGTLIILAVVILATGCSVGDRGATGAPGKDAVSIVGPKGDTGERGADGTNGRDGIDATPISMVKLCPNIQGSYNNFPEFAFNIGGVLYATYSSGGNAFTTQLYPGSYSTTTPYGNCTFTVGPDNQLQ